MALISSNEYLTVAQMRDNAQHIMNGLIGAGWTKNSACGVLGNMQTESTMNPGLWESRIEGNMKGGYGLVQWTPATNYTNWADSNGYSWGSIDAQINRILYEVEHKLQWINRDMTFYEFTQSKDTPYNLALLFIKAYERPKNPNQPIRGKQAEYWWNELSGEDPHPPGDGNDGGVLPPPSSSDLNKTVIGMLLSDSLNGWRF